MYHDQLQTRILHVESGINRSQTPRNNTRARLHYFNHNDLCSHKELHPLNTKSGSIQMFHLDHCQATQVNRDLAHFRVGVTPTLKNSQPRRTIAPQNQHRGRMPYVLQGRRAPPPKKKPLITRRVNTSFLSRETFSSEYLQNIFTRFQVSQFE